MVQRGNEGGKLYSMNLGRGSKRKGMGGKLWGKLYRINLGRGSKRKGRGENTSSKRKGRDKAVEFEQD